MSNIYRYSFPTISHFQIPHALDKWLNSVSSEELKLLLLVHSEAERTSRSEVPLSTDQICQRTGVHKTNIGKVRRALVDYGLLLTRKVGRNYLYIVTDPDRRRAVADKTSLGAIDFNAPPTVLTKYIQSILKDSKLTKEGMTGHCPIPGHGDRTASFVMDIHNGGRWRCRGCAKSGGLVALEQLLSMDAIGKTISRDAAHAIVRDKLRALGLGTRTNGKPGPSVDIVYTYEDEMEEIVFQVVRQGGRKDKIVQRRPDRDHPDRWIYDTNGCRNVLYRLPEILESSTVIVVEGEKDADALTKLGLKDSIGDLIAVTTCRNGAGSWLPEHSEVLKQKRIILCGDTDERGVEHMLQVKKSLEAAGIRDLVSICLPAEFKDVSHFLESQRPKRLVDLVGQDWLELIEDELTDI